MKGLYERCFADIASVFTPIIANDDRTRRVARSCAECGLTGGIGSGKSTVAQLMQSHGFAVIDLDRISHELTQAGGRAIAPIVAHFGSGGDGCGRCAQPCLYPRARVCRTIGTRGAGGDFAPMIEQEVFAQARYLAQQASASCMIFRCWWRVSVGKRVWIDRGG